MQPWPFDIIEKNLLSGPDNRNVHLIRITITILKANYFEFARDNMNDMNFWNHIFCLNIMRTECKDQVAGNGFYCEIKIGIPFPPNF